MIYICVDNIAVCIQVDSNLILNKMKEILPTSFIFKNYIDDNYIVIGNIVIKQSEFATVDIADYKKLLIHGGKKESMHKYAYYNEKNNDMNYYFPEEKTYIQVNKDDRSISCLYNSNLGAIRFFIKNLIFEYFYSIGYFTLHSAAVRFRNKAYLIIGEKGTGKTTMLLNLLAYSNEFSIIANDRVIINVNNNKVGAISADAAIRLTDETKKILCQSYNKENRVVSILTELQDKPADEKHYLSIDKLLYDNENKDRINEMIEVNGIILLGHKSNTFKIVNSFHIPSQAFVDDEDEHPNWLNIYQRNYDKTKDIMKSISFKGFEIGKSENICQVPEKILDVLKIK